MILYIMSAMILLSMQQSDINWVDVRPVKSNASVILKANRSKSKILMIQFPLAFKVCNLSSEKVCLYYHSYYINHTDKSRIGRTGWMGQGMLIFKDVDGKLQSPYQAGRIVTNPKECSEYIAYTYHLIGEQGNYQDVFSHYLEKMKEEEKDTLHIGTLEEIKMASPRIIDDFLKGDSIELDFWRIYMVGKEKGQSVVLPVKIL